MRDDRLAWLETFGWRDVECGQPVEPDTIYRVYSMTKPITTVAALMLYEEGRFQLDDPVAKFIPAFAGTRVFASGDAESFTTVPLARPITVHDLMVHTSGLTYGFQHEHAVDALYRNRGVEFNANLGPLADLVEAAAAQPLVFSAGNALELQRVHRRARPARRDMVRRLRSMRSSTNGSSPPSG